MTNSHRPLEGRVVCITGAASGIGRATAELFGLVGSTVLVTDIDLSRAVEVVDEIARSGGAASAYALDVSDPQAVQAVGETLAGTYGLVDVLVNNAGVAGFCAIDDEAYPQAWNRSLDVLLTGQQYMVRALLPSLRKSSAPRIVNVASTEALGGTARDSAYAAAKAGVVGFTRALAVELGREGITVNCVCPGPILTAMTEPIPAAERDVYARRRTALGRYGRPEEIAHMIVSLSMPAASYVTGAVIPVDGGLTARNA